MHQLQSNTGEIYGSPAGNATLEFTTQLWAEAEKNLGSWQTDFMSL
jgi:hypothetical protein